MNSLLEVSRELITRYIDYIVNIKLGLTQQIPEIKNGSATGTLLQRMRFRLGNKVKGVRLPPYLTPKP